MANPSLLVSSSKTPVEAQHVAVSIPYDVAALIRNVFLPRNPNKLRSATPEVRAAVVEFIRLLGE